ncbi:hypothetical protein HWV62_8601 [Athelia sp. TMB]|nr:hypothetical protein HWV62_8601 [Athelia sp. TMB]
MHTSVGATHSATASVKAVTSAPIASSSIIVSSSKAVPSSVKSKVASSSIKASPTKAASPSAKAASTSAAAPSPTSAASGTASSDINAYLNGHNSNRTIHDASPVTWNQTMADKAQTWANNCVFEHSGGSLGPWGENLSAGTGDYPIADGILAWTNEVSVFNPSNPSAEAALHFTQVVWKATKQIGCAVASCPNMFPGYGAANFYVCEYYPPGNVGGEYTQNVSV